MDSDLVTGVKPVVKAVVDTVVARSSKSFIFVCNIIIYNGPMLLIIWCIRVSAWTNDE